MGGTVAALAATGAAVGTMGVEDFANCNSLDDIVLMNFCPVDGHVSTTPSRSWHC